MLPTEITKAKETVEESMILLYGAPKIGKSTFCASAPGALFLATEPGLNQLDTFQVPITTWAQFLEACKEIAAGDHSFKTIVIDTIDNLWALVSDYICAKHKLNHLGDLEYGKGYSFARTELHRVLMKLGSLPYGLFLVSHEKESEIKTSTGTYTKVSPALPKSAAEVVIGLVDVILYATVDTVTDADGNVEEKRAICTKPSRNYEAGDRTGKLPAKLPLNYQVFAEAFAAVKSGHRLTATEVANATRTTTPVPTSGAKTTTKKGE